MRKRDEKGRGKGGKEGTEAKREGKRGKEAKKRRKEGKREAGKAKTPERREISPEHRKKKVRGSKKVPKSSHQMSSQKFAQGFPPFGGYRKIFEKKPAASPPFRGDLGFFAKIFMQKVG